MTEEQKEHLSLLLRKNSGKATHRFLNEGLSLIGMNRDRYGFLDLKESDNLHKRFSQLFQRLYVDKEISTYNSTSPKILQKAIDIVSRSEVGEELLVFFSNENVGAVKIQTREFFLFAFEMLLLDNDTLCVTDENFANIMLLDMEERFNEWWYEIMLWGDDWSDPKIVSSIEELYQ